MIRAAGDPLKTEHVTRLMNAPAKAASTAGPAPRDSASAAHVSCVEVLRLLGKKKKKCC